MKLKQVFVDEETHKAIKIKASQQGTTMRALVREKFVEA